MRKIYFIFIISISILFTSCSDNLYDKSKQQRADLAEKASEEESTDDIVVGVAWLYDDDNFIRGLKLGLEEVNNSGGIFNKRKIRLKMDYTENNVSVKSLREKQAVTVAVADGFAADPQLIAVIGHRYSYSAIPASIVYENHGILYLAPTATTLNLTNHHFNYLFRMMPNNEKIAQQIACYVYENIAVDGNANCDDVDDNVETKNIVILHTRSAYGTELSDSFIYTIVERYHAKIVLRHSFFGSKKDFTSILIGIKRLPKVDAIFVATGAKLAAKIYAQARDLNISVPFIGGESLDEVVFWKIVREWEREGEEKNKSFVPTAYRLGKHTNTLTSSFVENYKKNYNAEPNRLAFLGYDAIKLLQHGILTANSSTVPSKIAEALRYMPPCLGISGKYYFHVNGESKERNLYFKSVDNKNSFNYHTTHKGNGKSNFYELCGNIDIDGDGIPNYRDKCPTNSEKVGKEVYKQGNLRGCPIDDDLDSVPNYLDKCPNTLKDHLVDSYGCLEKNLTLSSTLPKDKQDNLEKDFDNDGIVDSVDQCPENTSVEVSKGILKKGSRRGCPVDNDEDGVLDYEDNCLNTPSDLIVVHEESDQKGCQLLTTETFISSGHFDFARRSAELPPSAMKYLDTILTRIRSIQLLRKIEIIGYTDSVGNAKTNKILSIDRATTVANYFILKGIDKHIITITGLGELHPIASNKTLIGRSRNRRIEIRIIYAKKRSFGIL